MAATLRNVMLYNSYFEHRPVIRCRIIIILKFERKDGLSSSHYTRTQLNFTCLPHEKARLLRAHVGFAYLKRPSIETATIIRRPF